MIDFFHQFSLLVGVKACKEVKDITCANDTEIPEVGLHDFADSECLKPWRTLKEQTQLISGNGFELGQVVILGFAGNLHCHLPQGPNAV